MLTADTSQVVDYPPAPRSLEESGLSLDLMIQLVLKTLHLAGELTGGELAKRLGVRFQVVEPALSMLKLERHCEIVGGSMLGTASYRYRITDAGRVRAALFLEHNHYVGRAPVPLEQYRQYLLQFQRAMRQKITRDRVRRAFSHLVLSDRVLDQLGPAINAAHSMFVYGPPGNGKTVISGAIRGLLDGEIAVPHALEVEGSIIRVFDPVNHEPVDERTVADGLEEGLGDDQRWVRCRRPMVMVGGELTLEKLELSYSPGMGFYRAPVQAVANGGVLVIDDFGRQACSPREFLNRWIVPLESRIDFLTLQTGQKFEIPFMTLIVFATNIKPVELADEAFLRRIHYKIFAESPTLDEFMRIFENYCRHAEVEFDRRMVELMLDQYYRPRQIPLRGCHPRDLIEHALSLAEYLGEPRKLTLELLEEACAGYFVDDNESAVTYAQS
jgi:predicted ATPase with chaperone activity